MASLPNFPKSRAVEGQRKIGALIKAFNYIITIKSLEVFFCEIIIKKQFNLRNVKNTQKMLIPWY